MTSKRKTPARRKTTPAQSPLAAAPVPTAPSAEIEADPISAPVQALIAAPSSLPAPGPVKAEAIESAPAPSAQLAPPPARLAKEERHRMIAKVAYGYAEKAGFRNNPVEDWLRAEREVEARLQRLAS
jgi:hypothetical protein